MTNMITNKGIYQEIIDEQRKLDKTVIRDRDLFNIQNQPDLTVNFDVRRKHALLVSYIHFRTAVRMLRVVGAKWWKNQEQMSQEQFEGFMNDVKNGKYLDTDIDLSNTSMKIMAIVQELVELEDSINGNSPTPDIHEEYIDVIHFVVSLGLDLGLNSEQEVRELYLKKNLVNHQRIQSNY